MFTLFCPCCGCRLDVRETASRLESVCPRCKAVISGSVASPEGGGFFRLTVSPVVEAVVTSQEIPYRALR
jgi:hypothetical protein